MTPCVEVSIRFDVVMVFGVLVVLPLVVGVGITTWIVSVGPSSVKVYMHSTVCQSLQLLTVHTTCCSMLKCTVLTIPVLTTFNAGCRLMLGPLTAHTFTL